MNDGPVNRHRLGAYVMAAMLFAMFPPFGHAADLVLKFVIGGRELILDVNTVIESSVTSTRCHLDDPNLTCVAVRFSREAKDSLADMTTANVGRPMYIVLGDRIINDAIIRQPMLRGTALFIADVQDVPALLQAMR